VGIHIHENCGETCSGGLPNEKDSRLGTFASTTTAGETVRAFSASPFEILRLQSVTGHAPMPARSAHNTRTYNEGLLRHCISAADTLLMGWLLLKIHWRTADARPLQVDSHLDAVGDLDEGNAAVHALLLTIEGHCPLNSA
jgi:hypothetical protein